MKTSTIIIAIVIVAAIGFGIYWFGFRKKEEESILSGGGSNTKTADKDLKDAGKAAVDAAKVATDKIKEELKKKQDENLSKVKALINNLNKDNVPYKSGMDQFASRVKSMGYTLDYDALYSKWFYVA